MNIMLPDSAELTFLAGDSLLPVTDVSIKGKVDGHGVVWIVAVEFENLLGETAEGTFTIPLPHSGSVSGMKMVLGTRTVVADIKERDQARREYHEAVERGQSAALLEQNRAEIFSISVGNVHPRESIRVEVTVHDSVTVDGREASLRMPTMIKTRYIPEGVADGHDISAPTVSARAFGGGNVNIEFSSHADDLVCDTTDTARVGASSVEITGFPLTSDIVLRWKLPATIASAKWVADDDGSDNGTLEVELLVDKTQKSPRRRKAVQIMFDRSGSMSTHYLEWARRIVADIITVLDADDKVHVLTFDSVIESLAATEGGFAAATNTVKKDLMRELATVTARGGTSLTEALQASGAVLGTLDDHDDDAELERVAVLITDGAYGDEASAAFHRENELKGARVIAVAIGENANGYLEVLASNGICVYVPSEDTLSESAAKVVGRIETPALRGVHISSSGLTDTTPNIAPDVYPGLVRILAGRMPRPADGTTVDVISSDGPVLTIPVTVTEDASATTRWAGAYIKSLDYEMMSRVDDDSEGDELEKRIVALSVKYRVLSKYTAWLAVDMSRPEGDPIIQNVILPKAPDIDLLAVSSLLRHSSPMMPSADLLEHVVFFESEPRRIVSRNQPWKAPDRTAMRKLQQAFPDDFVDSPIDPVVTDRGPSRRRRLKLMFRRLWQRLLALLRPRRRQRRR